MSVAGQSCRPSGAGFDGGTEPSAHALGYRLTALRAWGHGLGAMVMWASVVLASAPGGGLVGWGQRPFASSCDFCGHQSVIEAEGSHAKNRPSTEGLFAAMNWRSAARIRSSTHAPGEGTRPTAPWGLSSLVAKIAKNSPDGHSPISAPQRLRPRLVPFRVSPLRMEDIPRKRKNRDCSRFFRVVPAEGLEPPLPLRKQILSLSRLPFRHAGNPNRRRFLLHPTLPSKGVISIR